MNTVQFLLTAWDWNPAVIAAGVLALGVYALRAGLRHTRAWFFAAGVAVYFLTLVSPLNALARGYLFSAHMMQHMLLLLVVPPMLLLGLPTIGGDRSRGFRLHPLLSWFSGLTAMWVWHAPSLCDAATRLGPVRVVQVLSLLGLGALFWWPIVGPQTHRRLEPLLGVAYLVSACISCTILGILVTFAPTGVVCPIYMHPTDTLGILPLIRKGWGLTPGMDQQAGGLMMWVPACGVYVCASLGLLARWYRAAEATDAVPATAHTGPAHPIGENL